MKSIKINKQEIHWENDCLMDVVRCPKCTDDIYWMSVWIDFPKYCSSCGVKFEWGEWERDE